MAKVNNQRRHDDDDDDIIILSSGSDNDDEEGPVNASDTHIINKTMLPPPPPSSIPPAAPEIKTEKEPQQLEAPELSSQINHNNSISHNNSNNSTNTTVPRRENLKTASTSSNALNEKSLTSAFNFSAFSLFGPDNASMPIEERLASFINNVQSLTEEKHKLENAQRAAKQQFEEADSQLSTANQEISKLKENLVVSQGKLKQQDSSISTLKNEVEKLRTNGSGSKTQLKSISSSLVNLQKKMVQILDDAEVDSSFLTTGAPEQAAPDTWNTPAAICNSGSTGSSGSSSLTEVILQENIENFERDFDTKFSHIEEQDQEIKNELARTNEMLQRIQTSLMEQFQANPSGSSSPQLTYESMEEKDVMSDEQSEPVPCSSRSSSTSGNGNNKVSHQDDSKTNTLLHARDTTKKNGCICGVRYKTKYSLNRHLRMERGQNHFACNVCTATFFELCNLRKHYESAHQLHYPPNVAGCTACGKVFDSFELLQKHRKRCNSETGLPVSNSMD